MSGSDRSPRTGNERSLYDGKGAASAATTQAGGSRGHAGSDHEAADPECASTAFVSIAGSAGSLAKRSKHDGLVAASGSQ